MELQETTIKLCWAMLICRSLASVWPRSVHNYSSLALTHKLITKDKQEFCVSTPRSPQISYEIFVTVNRAVSSGFRVLPEDIQYEAMGYFSLDICLKKSVLFSTYEGEERAEGWRKGGWGARWRSSRTHTYLFMLKSLPVVATQSASVPISDSFPSTTVCVTEEAAGWVLTGCCGTERGLWHLS